MRLALPTVLVSLLLTGCGQTGGLYLPDKPASTVEQTPAPATSSEAPASEDEAARTKKK